VRHLWVAAAAGALALSAPACSSNPGKANSAPAQQPSLAATGAALVLAKPCLTCHTTNGASGAGPTFKGLYGSKVHLSDGSVVSANDVYLERAIRDPDAQTVAGYRRGLMATVIPPGSISPRQAKAIVAYLATLSDHGLPATSTAP
jgi:cytochrome c oxidase subunit 2